MARKSAQFAVAAGILVSILLSGCTQPEQSETGLTIGPAPKTVSGARAQFLALVGTDPNVDAAVASERTACMAKAGFSYVPLRNWAFDLDANNGTAPQLSVEEARKSGYATTASEIEDRKHSEPDVGEMPTGYEEALYGDGEDADIAVELFGSETSWTAGGCTGEAADAIYGSPKNELLAENVIFNVGLEVLTAYRDDPKIVEVAAEWQKCMSATNFPQFRAPFEAFSSTAGSRDSSIELAVDDATCREKVDYTSKLDRLLDRYISTFLTKYSADLVEIEQIRRDSQLKAREVLGG
ncbi:hypothetical protein QT381_15580 [Galbitalea sp. SE-J8]|uniref:hypothetical protein n=1 Tax=Galbitalea sp. SE-J8 TaxID=3054952 RepID=UPI00259C9770|nr:hypothetical protein [Galbitalea sp. SE-J8]MDM4764420.1 hypothetical protein [Galbitalea sp. SE-J8]